VKKTCLVIGNGPSLAGVPNKFLARFSTFGSNRIYLKFVPEVYACVNPLVTRQYRIEIVEMKNEKYIDSITSDLIPDCFKIRDLHRPEFSTVPGFYGAGYTVTSVLLQIAYWYGYKRVGLIGVDHRYTFEGKPNQELTAGAVDPNHFDSSYFSNVQWNAPDLKKSEVAYKLAKEAFEEAGGEVINLSPESALNVFKRGDWREW
jgi:hypothetical protein